MRTLKINLVAVVAVAFLLPILVLGAPKGGGGGNGGGGNGGGNSGQNDIVASFVKVSDTQGGLAAGTLADEDLFGRRVAYIGDVDGDGIQDMAVTTPGYETGAVHVLFLNADGTVRDNSIITAPSASARSFGSGLAGLGDLNGDGTPDIAVGSESYQTGGFDLGGVFVLFLAPDGSVASSQTIALGEGGFSGDLDIGDRFGSSVANLGDFNGDGVTDLLVGALTDDVDATDNTASPESDRGAVYILYLNTDGTIDGHSKIAGLTGLQSEPWFGHSVTSLGDVDGDGVTDIAVGISQWDGAGIGSGAFVVILLNPDGTVKSFQSDNGLFGQIGFLDVLGLDIVGIGDYDNDGTPDLAVGAPGEDSAKGAVFIVTLNTDGSVKAAKKISNTTGGLGATLDPSDGFGVALASRGDSNGDGVPDIVVGAWGDDDGGLNRGAIYELFLKVSKK